MSETISCEGIFNWEIYFGYQDLNKTAVRVEFEGSQFIRDLIEEKESTFAKFFYVDTQQALDNHPEFVHTVNQARKELQNTIESELGVRFNPALFPEKSVKEIYSGFSGDWARAAYIAKKNMSEYSTIRVDRSEMQNKLAEIMEGFSKKKSDAVHSTIMVQASYADVTDFVHNKVTLEVMEQR